MNSDEFFADLLMLAHAGYSLFVVLGLLLVLVGMILGWRWTRARGFRVAHLAAMLFALLRVGMGWPCPFSVAENVFRSRTAAPCPLGGSFHEVLHLCAFSVRWIPQKSTAWHFFLTVELESAP